METQSEPYVRLASLRQMHRTTAHASSARSLADTLQRIVDGVVEALGYESSGVHVVRPDGDLVVSAVNKQDGSGAERVGRVATRDTWEQRLEAGEAWGDLRFVPSTQGREFGGDDLPGYPDGPPPRFEDQWHLSDRLFAPMFAAGVQGGSYGELIGVLSVDRPRNGRRPGAWGREALQMYAFQAAIAISNARLRADMQRALVRLEGERQALRASEESFRQAFEYAPSGMAIAEMGGDQHGRILRTNDALCRLLGRPASAMRRYSFSDLVHPEDGGTLLRMSAEGGGAELRLGRRDGSYVWVSLRNSVVADAAGGPRFLLTHVEDVQDRRDREFHLAHLASHDALTGLPNSAELRTRLAEQLCDRPSEDEAKGHVHTVAPEETGGAPTRGLAVVFCDLDGMYEVNERFGHPVGDTVLVEVGKRLEAGLREGDTVARYGGDEFVILAHRLAPDECQEVLERLRLAVEAPLRIDGRFIRVTASFGTAWAACGTPVKDVLHTADLRMFEEKRARAAARAQEPSRPVVTERRIAAPMPECTGAPWVPQRPAVQRNMVRTWQTGAAPSAITPTGSVEVRSAQELARLGGSPHVHRVVLRGDVTDLSGLRRLPALRDLVIADNPGLSYLDELEGCHSLRFLAVSGCGSLADWVGAAGTGVMFVEVGPGHAVAALKTLRKAGRLRRLTLREALSEGDEDLEELRHHLPGVQVQVQVQVQARGEAAATG
ncbi:MAG: diguanylate cyclase [Streptomyces sp.]|nr:diguanylate cyclase [Streptomyces sp.]NUS24733.1 diguanylate cyclase [Streptomyces sp.]